MEKKKQMPKQKMRIKMEMLMLIDALVVRIVQL